MSLTMAMNLIRDLFEAHLTVGDLDRSMRFYTEILGLRLASRFPERRAAFFWIGEPCRSMLGLWETGSSPQRLSLHVAFTVPLPELLKAPALLKTHGITPLDFSRNPTSEPVVLAWMPAASLYFRDPDDNLLEFLCMLPDTPRPELGVVLWTRWVEHLRSQAQ